ncbi:hypothetical protein PWT90_00435 [Aphanocladium album]|nr:hypothetical protein PWT90_00435 [Aphanocladium album]
MLQRNTLLAVAWYPAIVLTTISTSGSNSDFDWSGIKPSPQLTYYNCYDKFKCARLVVPLDWQNASDPRRATIPILTLPAAVPINDTSFAGGVLANPGGPGGSGIEVGIEVSALLQSIIDKPDCRHYEITWFDPRGIGRSTPTSDCFHNDLTRSEWAIEGLGAGGMNGLGPGGLNKGNLAYRLALNKGFAQQCVNSEKKRGAAMAYVGTASVARDMVEIIDRIEEQRRDGHGSTTVKPLGTNYDLDTRYDLRVAIPRLRYIGFSYGTVIGNYFASMFPGRVERMVLDGVLDAEDYTTGPGWTTNLVDADEEFEEFWKGCFAVGPEVCELAQEGNAQSAQRRFWAWVSTMDEIPYSFIDEHGNINILAGDGIRRFVTQALYTPVQSFKTMQSVLHKAMGGDEAALQTIFGGIGSKPSIQEACKLASNGTEPPPPGGNDIDPANIEVEYAILCGDGDDVTEKNASWWMDYAQKLEKQSRVVGRYWSSTRLMCSSWPFRANWRFTGPFTSPKPDASRKPGVPSAPILFLSNRLDPVTPLASARKMSAGHPGSRVVMQDALGHCALLSAQSNCTYAVLADYLDTGKVPEEGFTCNANCGPWDANCTSPAI